MDACIKAAPGSGDRCRPRVGSIPAYLVTLSISSISSAESGRALMVATFCSSCATLLAPTKRGRHPGVTHRPGKGELRDGLPTPLGDLAEGPYLVQLLFGQSGRIERSGLPSSGVGGDPVEVTVSEEALGEWGEHDAADAEVPNVWISPYSGHRLKIEYAG